MIVKNYLYFSILLFILNLAYASQNKQEKSGKIVLLRGTVLATMNKKIIKLKKNDWVYNGQQISTKKASLVKIILNDKSRLSLGPNSNIIISKGSASKPGLISLLKGKLRSNVNKNVLDTNKKEKLYIKTKTAAMGVRGTEFQVNYNRKNSQTSLVTFSGKVVISKISLNTYRKIKTADNMSNAFVSGKATIVKEGQYSGVNQKSKQTISVTISPAQFQRLKTNTDFEESNIKSKKNFRPPIPPGITSKSLTNNNEKVIEENMKEDIGKSNFDSVMSKLKEKKDETATEEEIDQTSSLAEGGLVDLNTGLYIPPPPGSTFDNNTGLFIPPPNMGGFDDKGNYIPPEGHLLTDQGKFIKDESKTDTPERKENMAPLPPPPSSILSNDGQIVFTDPDNPILGDPGDPLSEAAILDETLESDGTDIYYTDELAQYIEDISSDRDDDFEDQIDQEILNRAETTRVKFIINIES